MFLSEVILESQQTNLMCHEKLYHIHTSFKTKLNVKVVVNFQIQEISEAAYYFITQRWR